jgi:ATP-dependent RNA helicase DOB1
VHRRFPAGIPLLDPVKDMNIKDKDFIEMSQRSRAFEERLLAHPMHQDKKVETLCQMYHGKLTVGRFSHYSIVSHKVPKLSVLFVFFFFKQLANELKAAKDELKKAKSLLQMTELKCRKRVLRRLGYCTAADVIDTKGRVACELSSADELLLTEMIFNGLFNSLDVIQTVALLSCFVCDEKSSEMPKLSESLSGPLKQMQDLARRIAKVSLEAKLELEEDSYVEQFKPYMMDVVAAWCRGATFGDICKMTDIFEGN